MKLSEQKAREAAEYMVSELKVDRVKAFDIMLILALIGVIIELVKLIRWWCGQSSDQAIDTFRKPGIVGKILLRRAINKVAKEQLADREDLAKLSVKIRTALLATSEKMTPEEAKALFQEIPEKAPDA